METVLSYEDNDINTESENDVLNIKFVGDLEHSNEGPRKFQISLGGRVAMFKMRFATLNVK